MPINSQEALIYSQEGLRPMSEKVRNIKIEMESLISQWWAGKNALFSNDGELVADSGQAAHPYTGANANSMMGTLISVVAVLDGIGVMDNVLPITVRQVNVGG